MHLYTRTFFAKGGMLPTDTSHVVEGTAKVLEFQNQVKCNSAQLGDQWTQQGIPSSSQRCTPKTHIQDWPRRPFQKSHNEARVARVRGGSSMLGWKTRVKIRGVASTPPETSRTKETKTSTTAVTAKCRSGRRLARRNDGSTNEPPPAPISMSPRDLPCRRQRPVK